jgi:fructokinase
VLCSHRTALGLLHPEGGHIPIKRMAGDTFKGNEPFHGDCVEGLCNSIAIADRTGCARDALKGIPDDHPVSARPR